VTDRLPPSLARPGDRARLGEELVDALAEIHAVDWQAAGLGDFGRPTGYLERQVRRSSGLWEVNATRELPEVAEVGEWLGQTVPESGPATVVHGDYRLGNVLVAAEGEARVLAVLDWELATIGDPLADLGYLLATWAEPGGPDNPMQLSPVTREPGFPSRAQLAERYEERTGRRCDDLAWYEALALWKAAVFCEAIYGRELRGETRDDWAASLGEGVPALVRAASAAAARV
jgi:aminoglycoside phosphotransferase (APT) family kinase protein